MADARAIEAAVTQAVQDMGAPDLAIHSAGVLHNGPAALAGIRPGDVVTQVATAPVNNTSQLLNTVAALPPGKTAAIKVQRGNEAMSLSVVVAKRPKASVQPQIRSQEE